MSRSYRRRIALVLLTGIVAAACVGLGIWQLNRLHSRRSLNATLLKRSSEPVAALPSLSLQGGRDDPSAYRRVVATGTYDIAHEIVLRARADQAGHGGNHVLTPLKIAGGEAIIVDRGWVPLSMDTPRAAAAAPPSGLVEVTGLVVPSEPKPILFGPHDPADGTLQTIGRIDVRRIAKQVPYPMAPMYLALEKQSPAQAQLPVLSGFPAPGEGPHLSYAIQWFLFATVALVTGVLLMRRERSDRATMQQ